MRLLYSTVWLFALPVLFLYLLWRAVRQPDYLRHWPERLGWGPGRGKRPRILVHAVSVGETRAAAPLVQALLARSPEHEVVLSHTTPTGRATGQALFDGRVTQTYLPYDFPPLVWLFLARTRPRLCVVMETEIWPNLFAACARRNIPLLLVNARLSERSARGYRRVARLVRPALAGVRAIAAQTAADAARIAALGGENVEVVGNMKFDITVPGDTAAKADTFRQLFHGRFVWLAASTRDGEEALLLDALASLDLPDLLLVIVPRHPQRFDDVAGLLRARGMCFARRSAGEGVTAQTRVFLGDSMGELAAYYAAADVAYIGGSLLPFGGQNLIEAAAAGCPVLIGPHTWNFTEAAEQAVARGAAWRVADVAALVDAVRRLHADAAKRADMAAAGRAFAAENRGATERVYALIARSLGERPAAD